MYQAGFPLETSQVHSFYRNNHVNADTRTFYGGRRALQSAQWTAGDSSTNLNVRLSNETIQGTMQVYSELLPEKVGWPVVPVLVTPDDQWIQDSEDITHHLEAKFPDKKVLNAFIIMRPSYI